MAAAVAEEAEWAEAEEGLAERLRSKMATS
jgi:hypothetical protein